MATVRAVDPEVTEALKRLYAIRVRPPKVMHGCPCCVSGEMKHALSGLRELLTVERMGPYPSKAMTTWGSLEDYEHYLPRILELSFERPPRLGYRDHALAGKLRRLEIESRWSKEERESLATILRAHWVECNDIDPESAQRSEHYDWLANFGDLVGPLHELLWDWQSNTAAGARAALRWWYEWDQRDGARRPAPKGWPSGEGAEAIGVRVAPWLRALKL